MFVQSSLSHTYIPFSLLFFFQFFLHENPRELTNRPFSSTLILPQKLQRKKMGGLISTKSEEKMETVQTIQKQVDEKVELALKKMGEIQTIQKQIDELNERTRFTKFVSKVKTQASNAVPKFKETKDYIEKQTGCVIESACDELPNIHVKIGNNKKFILLSISFSDMVTDGCHSEFYIKKMNDPNGTISKAFWVNDVIEYLLHDTTRGVTLEDTKEIFDAIVTAVIGSKDGQIIGKIIGKKRKRKKGEEENDKRNKKAKTKKEEVTK